MKGLPDSRMDFVGCDLVIAVEKVTHVHEAQLLSCLRLYDRRVGLLFNFNVKWLVQEGLKRLVNSFPEQSSPRPPRFRRLLP